MFNFISNWRQKLIDDPLDGKMTEAMQVGLNTARDRVHVDTGKLKASIGATYNKSTKTILLHADTPYAWVEEFRPPIPSHSYLGPAMQAMAGFWGGTYNLEAHFPNAAPKGRMTSQQDLQDRESRWRKANLGFLARRKVKVITRRWHRRTEWPQADPTTPLI